MVNRVCYVCGAVQLNCRGRKFFRLPNGQKNFKPEDNYIVALMKSKWLQLIGENEKKYYGEMRVCSIHFVSGAPAYYRDRKNIDWIPSQNLGNLTPVENEFFNNCEVSNGADDHNYSVPPVDNATMTSSASSNDEPPVEPRCIPPEVRCCVEICGKVGSLDTVLFRFPEVSSYPLLNHPAVARRRDAWLAAVGWAELSSLMSQPNSPKLFICSDHFQGKKPAPLICENHVDWKPTLLLRDPISAKQGDLDPLNFVEIKQEMMDDLPQLPSDATDSLQIDCHVTPDEEIENFKSKLSHQGLVLEEKTRQLTEKSLALEESLLELNALKKKLADAELNQKEQQKKAQQDRVIHELRDNDQSTKFYTGLKSWSLFTTVFNAVHKPDGFSQRETLLSFQQEFLMALMRLRLNLLVTDLAHRFNTSQSRASRVCHRWVDLIFYQLPASNISTGTGAAQLMPNSEMSVEEKLRKNLKRFFFILTENAITNDMYLEDKLGFSFLYKATYVCDYLMKMNSDTDEPPTLFFKD